MKNNEFATFIRKKGDDYIAFVPKLAIIKKGKSLDSLYSETEEEISIRSPKVVNKTINTGFYKKLITAFSVCTFLMLIFVIATNVGLKQVANHKYLRFERKLNESLNPTQEKQLERIERFKAQLRKAKPYIKELKSLLDD